jgi:lamin tail-like protein
MVTKIIAAIAVISAFYVAWAGGRTAYSQSLENQVISPGDIAINAVSNSEVDWVTLHNNLDHVVNLHGFVFTDGDNIFTLPGESVIQAGGDLRIASSRNEGDVSMKVDYYWGDWGLSKDGELVMLINDQGDMVVDFVFAPPLDDGEILERFPSGTGPLMDSKKSQSMQMKRPSYRAVPVESIEGIGKNFSTSVISIGGLLTTVSTVLLNLDQSKEILEKFGLFPTNRKRNKS